MFTDEDWRDVAEQLCTNLAERRNELGITQTAVSGRTGLPQSRISDYERGDRVPELQTVYRLADGLECSVCDLLPDSANG